MNNRATLATIGEIIQDKQPEIFKALSAIASPAPMDITAWVTSAAWLTEEQEYYARIMRQKPRPGRGVI